MTFFAKSVSCNVLFSNIDKSWNARLRITQVVSSYWFTVSLIALIGLVLLMWDVSLNVGW